MNLKYASDDSYDDDHNVDDDNVGDDDDDDGDKQLNCLDFCSKGNRCVFWKKAHVSHYLKKSSANKNPWRKSSSL